MSAGRQKARTCVGCREESPKRALIRIVRSPDGSVRLDERGKLPGRGAYLCLCSGCVERARKAGALARALRTEIPPAFYAELLRHVEALAVGKPPEEAAAELCGLLGLSRRAGMVRIGMDGVQSQCATARLLILTAADCSQSVMNFVRKIVGDNASPRHEHLPVPLSVERLSAALGAGCVQVVGLPLKGGLAQKIKILFGKGGDALEQQNTGLRTGEDVGKEQ